MKFKSLLIPMVLAVTFSLAREPMSGIKDKISKCDSTENGIAVKYHRYKEITNVKSFEGFNRADTVKYQRWDTTEYVLTDTSFRKTTTFYVQFRCTIHF